MKPTRLTVLATVLIAVAAVAWAVVRFLYTSLPLLPWTMVPSLLLLSLGELYAGLVTRARIQRRPGTKPIEALVAARLAALGKASSHAAAVIAGGFAGIAVYLLSSLDKPSPRHDFFVSGGTFLAGIALAAAALFLEYACRVPKGPEDEDEPRSAERS
jgi:Protein of unknown function (DUF3180)